MKRFLKLSLAGLLAFGIPQFARAEVVLSYSPWNPSTYGANAAIFPWFEKIKEITEGRVRVEPRAAAVGAPRDQADVVSQGLVDMSLIVTGYTPGRYPLVDLFSLPLLSADGEKLSVRASEIFERHFSGYDMFDNAVALTVFVGVPAHLVTLRPLEAGSEAVTGKKLYISNRPTATLLSELGASPVTATVAEVFSMASGGVIDGAAFGYETTKTFGLTDYFRNFIEIEGGLGQASWALLVNKDAWNKIEMRDREAIKAISGAVLSEQIGAALMQGENGVRKELIAAGVKSVPASADFMTALRAQADAVNKNWVESARKTGLDDPEAVLIELQKELK